MQVPAVSSLPIGSSRLSSMAPVSIPSSICISVTPVTVSPRISAHWIGAARDSAAAARHAFPAAELRNRQDIGRQILP